MEIVMGSIIELSFIIIKNKGLIFFMLTIDILKYK